MKVSIHIEEKSVIIEWSKYWRYCTTYGINKNGIIKTREFRRKSYGTLLGEKIYSVKLK
jgi:hypothetical protein